MSQPQAETEQANTGGDQPDLQRQATYPPRDQLDKRCDLIMKGGITSGVIYPQAICELARTHTIVKIGGTSAGAIAAGAAAAAELGRDQGGFARLAQLPVQLVDSPPGSNHTGLFHLFQAQPSTRALYRFLLGFIGHGSVAGRAGRGMVNGVRLVQPIPLLVCLVLPLVVLVAAIAEGGVIGIVLAGLFAGLGVLAAVVWSLVRRFGRDLQSNHLGLCSGMGGPGHGEAAPLTTWLADAYDTIAGRTDPSRPVTFGDLTDNGIELAMFTTNLSLSTQVQLPITSRVWAFDPSEFRELFPERIVDWMEANPPEARPGDEAAFQHFRDQGLAPLPDERKLPIVVGVRMSLSFPVLLSTVPLHAMDHRAKKIRRHRFSDGGITSNFPLHFFDEPIPTRSTFAISLAPTETADPDPAGNVSMPRSNRSGILLKPVDVETVGQLAGAVSNAMQNWGDVMQTQIPGYRDRIVTVQHTKDEGGLNLDMDADVVYDLMDRGRSAGERAQGFELDDHRWIRFRSFLQLLEDFVAPAAAELPAMRGELDGERSAYELAKRPGHNLIDAVVKLDEAFKAERRDDGQSRAAHGAPSPRPRLEIRPQP